jgi:hypothetical protein
MGPLPDRCVAKDRELQDTIGKNGNDIDDLSKLAAVDTRTSHPLRMQPRTLHLISGIHSRTQPTKILLYQMAMIGHMKRCTWWCVMRGLRPGDHKRP